MVRFFFDTHDFTDLIHCAAARGPSETFRLALTPSRATTVSTSIAGAMFSGRAGFVAADAAEESQISGNV